MLHKNLKPEELQRFMRKNRVKEAFIVDGMTFRDKKNAENHCGRKNIDPATIVSVSKEDGKSEGQKVGKAKSDKEKADKEVQN